MICKVCFNLGDKASGCEDGLGSLILGARLQNQVSLPGLSREAALCADALRQKRVAGEVHPLGQDGVRPKRGLHLCETCQQPGLSRPQTDAKDKRHAIETQQLRKYFLKVPGYNSDDLASVRLGLPDHCQEFLAGMDKLDVEHLSQDVATGLGGIGIQFLPTSLLQFVFLGGEKMLEPDSPSFGELKSKRLSSLGSKGPKG